MRTVRLALCVLSAGCLPNLPAYKGGDGDGTDIPDTGIPDTDIPDTELDADSDGYTATVDCDDTNANINPGASEACGGSDEDCDGLVDEADADGCVTFYLDQDRDGWGDIDEYRCLCEGAGLYDAEVSEDCDDSSSAVNPEADIVCMTGSAENCDMAAERAECRWEGEELYTGALTAGGANFSETRAGGGLGRAVAALDMGSGSGLMGIGRPARAAEWGGLGTGRAVLFQSPVEGAYVVDDAFTGDVILFGIESEEGFGTAVALHSDLDGAGWVDALVHSAGDDELPDYIGYFQGPLLGGATELSPDSAITVPFSPVGFEQSTIIDPGDFNQDGYGDLLLSNVTSLTTSATGGVWFIHGPVTADLELADRADGVFAIYGQLDSGFGARMASALDSAGDSVVAIGEPLRDGDHGAAHLLLGADLRQEGVDLTDGRTYGGVDDGNCGLGVELADLTGDGHLELVVGCPSARGGDGEIYIYPWSHMTADGDVLNMDSSDFLVRIRGSANEASVGINIVSAGDLDQVLGEELVVVATDVGSSSDLLTIVAGGYTWSGELEIPSSLLSQELVSVAEASGAGHFISDAVPLNDDPLPDLLVGVLSSGAADLALGGVVLVPGMGP